jgi:hypothetical protein
MIKRIAALLLISGGAIVCEHLSIFCYKIWWCRSLPLDSNTFVDGLGRHLEMAPLWARVPFGKWGYWIGSGEWTVDSWKVGSAVLLVYVLFRSGWLILQREFRGPASSHQ